MATMAALFDGNSSALPAERPAGVYEFPNIAVPTFDRKNTNDTLDTSLRTDSSKGSGNDYGHELDAIMRDVVGDDAHIVGGEARFRRNQQKDRMRERLERYKLDRRRLRDTCTALESALASTSQRLREVDSKAATRIEALESELRDQEVCIKELGTKLVRQARVCKKEKDAAEQYKMKLDSMNEAMAEEMAIQNERNSRQEEDARRREEEMLAMLRENIESIDELKSEAERDAIIKMELEHNLGQKVATLNKVTRDLRKKTKSLCNLEQRLKDKTFELESALKQLDDSKKSAEATRQQLEAAIKEIEDMKRKFTEWDVSKTDGKAYGDASSFGQSPSFWIDKIDKTPILDEAFVSELQAKNATTKKLEDACSYALLRFIWDG
ncbi:hypothetical protein ACHAW5_008660 [Stephanodiscus triporus]|uniref:Uncharacterized protein n=1 Tax=Stephanodiscus triporus TaxID=2934178 RepID=A0ABD3PNJ2_9STRA